METTLRSIGRRVGHTHGWLRGLGKAEEESNGREEGGGESCFFLWLLSEAPRGLNVKKIIIHTAFSFFLSI